MVDATPEAAAIYRPRRPRQSALYRLIQRYYPEFERTYDDRYAQRYGPWRPIIGGVVRKFLRCGDLHFGFARVRCTTCHHEMFVPFSCRQRCLCPSCHQKRSLLAAQTIAQTICAAVPHRQLVFTIPKRLRIYARYDRSLLGALAGAAWQSTVEVYRQVLGRDDVLPGMIAGIQSFGELTHFHPHIHAIATDGGFTADGTFLCLPQINTDSLHAIWQTKVFDLLLAAEKIDQATVDQMRSWPHSGFSVDNSVYLSPGDTAGLERLAEYILRCPFSLARVVRVTDEGSVLYRAEEGHCRRFPGPASADLRGGPRRNFQVFGALDFLAELTQHIPNKGEHLVRYYGYYSHRQRGIRAKLQEAAQEVAGGSGSFSDRQPGEPEDNDALGEKTCSTPSSDSPQVIIDRSAVDAQKAAAGDGPRAGSVSTWAMLIRRVYEVDPLECPKCGGVMKIISFIERCQQDVIERILRHCGLWEGPVRTPAGARPPPASSQRDPHEPCERRLVLDPEFLQSEFEEAQAEASGEYQLLLDPEFL